MKAFCDVHLHNYLSNCSRDRAATAENMVMVTAMAMVMVTVTVMVTVMVTVVNMATILRWKQPIQPKPLNC